MSRSVEKGCHNACCWTPAHASPDTNQDHQHENEGTATRSVDAILNFIGYGPLQVIAFILAGLTSLAFGLEIVIFAFLDIPIQEEWNLTSVEYAVLPSMTGLGNIVGGFFYGLLCDHYGRVWPYALIMLHVGIVGLASSFSQNFGTLVALRAVVSMAITGASTIMFSTLVEFLPVKNRGKVMVAILLVETIGICLMAGLAWWLVESYPSNGWRYIVVAAALPYFIPALYRVVFSIQSPRFLIAKGRYKEAGEVFKKMAHFNGKELPDSLLDQCNILIVNRVELQSQKHTLKKQFLSLFSLFKFPYLRTTLCLSVIFVTETASYFCVSTFLPSILKKFGMDPYFTSFMGYLGQLPGILLMTIIVEWRGVGRLNSLRFFTLMTICSFVLLAFVQDQAVIAVAIILLYFSMVPIISLLYTYMSEIYPTQIRTFALGFFTNLSAVSAVFLPYVTGYLAESSQHWLFPIVWAAVFLLQFVVSLFLNIETLERNLSDSL